MDEKARPEPKRGRRRIKLTDREVLLYRRGMMIRLRDLGMPAKMVGDLFKFTSSHVRTEIRKGPPVELGPELLQSLANMRAESLDGRGLPITD